MEELVGAAEGSDLGLKSVGEHDHRVVVEDLRDGVLVVGVVVAISHIHVLVVALELNEQERHAVHESHQVAAPPVHGTFHPKLLGGHEVVVLRELEVEHHGAVFACAPVWHLAIHGNAVAKHPVLLLVGGEQRVADEDLLERGESACALLFGQMLVQLDQGVHEVAFQEHFLVRVAPKGTVGPELLLVIAIEDVPFKFVAEQLSGGDLDGCFFRVS